MNVIIRIYHSKLHVNIKLAFLDLNNENHDNDLLILEAKKLLLNIESIKKAVDIGLLEIDIEVEYTDKWFPYYMGKRKIIYDWFLI